VRAALAAALLLGACAAQDGPAAREAMFSPEDFVVAGNQCGASEYAHLVGERFAETLHAAMPEDVRIIRYATANTLEYAPGRPNVILDGRGGIAAIGCF
jgi:hypothetical protein